MDQEVEFTADEQAILSGGDPGPVEQPQEQTPVEQPRGPDGKFASKAEEKAEEKPAEAKPEEKPDADKRFAGVLSDLKEQREENRQLRERTARMEERFQQVVQRFQQPQEQPKPPSWDDAPLEAGKRTDQRVGNLEQLIQAAVQQNAIVSAITAHETAFKAQKADYDDAVNHLRQARAAEYRALRVPEEQIPQLMNRDWLGVATSAIQQGRNIAEVAYELARARGYATAAPAQQPAQQQPEPAKQLDTLAAATGAQRSLGSVGGAAPANLTLQALADMDEADFAKLDDRTFRRIMGG